MQIMSYPTKTVYEWGEQLDLTGLTIQVWTRDQYGNETANNNGNPYVVKDRRDIFSVTGYNSNVAGERTLTVMLRFYSNDAHKWLSASEQIHVFVNEKAETTTTTVTTTSTTETTTTTTVPPQPDFELGDVNRDGNVDAKDATDILKAYAVYSTGGEPALAPDQKSAADVNEDGGINSKDASIILAYYSYLSTGGDMKLRDFRHR